jgi:N-methylhydantoinase B
METISGAWGARAEADGLDCASNVTGLQSNTPVEVLETEYPIELVQYGFVPDSGGAGKHRGGLSLLREYRYLADAGTLQIRADRVRFPPYGLFGGRPGGRSGNWLDPYGANLRLESKVKNRPLRGGEVVRHVLAAGGGYGWPFERAVAAVVEDVRDGKVTVQGARSDYGVAVDPDTFAVDEAETARLRTAMREAVDVAHPPLSTQ